MRALLTVVLLAVAVAAVAAVPPGLPGRPPQAPPPEALERHNPVTERAAATPGLAPWEPLPLLAGQTGWLPVLSTALAQPSPVLQRRALFLYGQLRAPEGVGPARRALGSSDRLVRLQAAVTLATLGDARGEAGTIVALREGPPWLQLYALSALWRLPSRSARAALRASAPYLDGFLAATLRQAVTAPPRRLKPGLSALGAAPLSLSDLWREASNTYVMEADHWWHDGDYEQSIRCQQTALFYEPDNVDGFTTVAWLQWSLGRHGQAVSTYRQAIAANPQSWEAAEALGLYYARHHQREEAVVYLRRAAELGSPPLHRRQLGHVLEALGRFDEASGVWNDILKLDPNDQIARRQLERLSARQK